VRQRRASEKIRGAVGIELLLLDRELEGLAEREEQALEED